MKSGLNTCLHSNFCLLCININRIVVFLWIKLCDMVLVKLILAVTDIYEVFS